MKKPSPLDALAKKAPINIPAQSGFDPAKPHGDKTVVHVPIVPLAVSPIATPSSQVKIERRSKPGPRPSGKAKSAAERMRAYRARKKNAGET